MVKYVVGLNLVGLLIAVTNSFLSCSIFPASTPAITPALFTPNNISPPKRLRKAQIVSYISLVNAVLHSLYSSEIFSPAIRGI